ncbi:MAG: peptide ABC transporter substrate-binding protein [Chloroflexales bacterium]|nr:peptide ABC transporter substrate-binding protein [Chloroflexales bacterium]
MARRIRWQIVVAAFSALLVLGLMGGLAISSTAVPSPLAGGTYVEAILGAPVQFNPLLNDPVTDPAGRDVSALVFNGLTQIGVDGLPEPALATAWQIDPSGTVYTFNLRRDVTWHDGQAFSADDVVFSLRSIQDSRFDGNPALVNLWRDILVDRIDDYTVRFMLRAPYAPFPSAVRVPILPAHLLSNITLDQWPNTSFASLPVGTGPYRFVELNNQYARLERNPSYFGGNPFIERIELRFIASPEAAVATLSRGEVQALGSGTVQELPQIALPPIIKRESAPLDEYVVLTFNLRQAPFDTPALRQALTLGLDKDALIAQEQLVDQVQRLDTPILTGWWAHNPEMPGPAFDPAAAAQTLTNLGYELDADGVRVRDGEALMLSLITDSDPRRIAAAQEVERQWQTLGVRIDIEQLDSPTLHQRLREHEFELAIHGWTRLGPDPDVFELWHSSQAEDGLNYAGLRDNRLDSLLASARMETELAARNDNYREFQERWIELAPSIILYQPLYTFLVDEQLGGFGFDQGDATGNALMIGREDRYRNVTRWFVNSAQEIRGNLR